MDTESLSAISFDEGRSRALVGADQTVLLFVPQSLREIRNADLTSERPGIGSLRSGKNLVPSRVRLGNQKPRCLGHKDHPDAPSGLIVDEESLRQQAARVALALHAEVFRSGRLLLTYTTEALRRGSRTNFW